MKKENDPNKEMLEYCVLYDGTQKSLTENPLKKEDDEFKWYMWRVEFSAVRFCNTEDEIKNELMAAVYNYSDSKFNLLWKKYLSY